MFRKFIAATAIAATALTLTAGAASAKPDKDGTTVPGHSTDRYDKDGNGIPDAGVFVNGHYTSLYASDGNGDYYWDLGDGRIYKTVDAVEDLDPETVVVCDYVINYRADFGNDPFMDTGSIHNNINCSDGTTYNSLIVHQDDPRYRGIPENSIWNTWEYKVNTQSGVGNTANPMHPINHVG